jgi:hypothetical protein
MTSEELPNFQEVHYELIRYRDELSKEGSIFFDSLPNLTVEEINSLKFKLSMLLNEAVIKTLISQYT